MFKIKSFRFWFFIFAIIIISINATGNDDYGILLYFTNPLLWLRYSNTLITNANIPIVVVYLSSALVWYCGGWLIDTFIKKMKENRD
ncbi:hypothetical protein D3C77_613800 [compost metagenome]